MSEVMTGNEHNENVQSTESLKDSLRAMMDGTAALPELPLVVVAESDLAKIKDAEYYDLPEEYKHIALTHRELQEGKAEKLTKAKFTVHLRPDMVRKIEIPKPEPGYSGEIDPVMQEQYATLCRIKADAEKVPELDFEPGVTLFVGPNGTGKTTWAKALYLACEANRAMMWEDYEEKSDYFSPKSKMDMVFNPMLGDPDSTFLQLSGLAPYLAKCMETISFSASKKGEYIDHAEAVGTKVSMAHDQRIGGYNQNNESINYNRFSGSGRQTGDRTIKSIKEEMYGFEYREVGPVIAFEDQPEEGADIKRQIGLSDELISSYPDGSIIIVPTNNYVLYNNPDIPRFDTEHPERGIFKPRDYQDKEKE